MTNFAIRYRQDATKFVASQVFPTIPTEKQSNKYLIFPKGYFMRDQMPVRGMGEEPAADGYELESGTFSCEERALRHLIDDRIDVNADQPINPDMRATEFLTERSLIKLDREWCAQFFTAGQWGTSWEGVVSGASEGAKTFDTFDQSGTEPILFFNQRSDEMEGKTGFRPNVMVLGAKAYTGLRNNPEVVKRVLYISQSEPALVGQRALAAAFEVDKIVVAKAVYNSAQEGAADKIEYIANSSDAMLAYAAPAPSLDTPSAGYTFAWTSLVPGVGNATAGVIYSGRIEQAWTDWYAIRSAYDMQKTASDLGMYFSDVVAD
jgi:hypothetical protein